MKTKVLYAILASLVAGSAFFFNACNKANEKKNIVTERIQYDVLLKSPGPDYAWWVQNLEGPAREKFIRSIISAAYEGKVKAYDTDYKLMSPEEVKALKNRTDTIIGPSPVPPYNDTTMVITQKLELDQITRIRFMEEWTMDATTLEIGKKIIGICPVIENFDEQGQFRGLEPLFWVYFDKAYPAKFELK